MSVFEFCLANVLEDEKGFVDNPLDKGGPTNLGCTLDTLQEFLGRKATVEEIKALTPQTVKPIYRKLFWDANRMDEFPELLAFVFFNQLVLRRRNAVKTLQASLGLKADGVVGPMTIEALKGKDPRKLGFEFLKESQLSYIRICQAEPTQLAFLGGWTKRLWRLVETVK